MDKRRALTTQVLGTELLLILIRQDQSSSALAGTWEHSHDDSVRKEELLLTVRRCIEEPGCHIVQIDGSIEARGNQHRRYMPQRMGSLSWVEEIVIVVVVIEITGLPQTGFWGDFRDRRQQLSFGWLKGVFFQKQATRLEQ